MSGEPAKKRRKGSAELMAKERELRLPYGEPNVGNVDTEAEKELQNLLRVQSDTQITLLQQFQRHRAFQVSSKYVPMTQDLSGSLTLNEFQEHEFHKQKIDDMRQMGLDDCEVQMKLQHDGIIPIAAGNLIKNPCVVSNMLSSIEEKIQLKQNMLAASETFRGAKQLSRHEMELEKAIKPTSVQSQLLQHLVTTRKPEETHPDDPINFLKDMEQRLQERVNRLHSEKQSIRRSETKSSKDCTENDGFEKAKDNSSDHVPSTFNPSKFGPNETDPTLQSCSSSQEPKKITSFCDETPEDVIRQSRLNLDEIKGLEKFKDYDPGSPTNVLFLKNLTKTVKVADLLPLFGRFQHCTNAPLSFRLMEGKMKGTAFVTFPDADTASKALQLLNGFQLKGKPMIIEYGKRKTEAV